jgi:glutathione gamma-glutamylcysteinyltransferase
MAKYCVEDLPNLLKTENLDNVPTLLSHLIGSFPTNAGSFIKWVVEARRKEECGQCLSKEEEERLLVKVAFPFHFLLLDQSFFSLT